MTCVISISIIRYCLRIWFLVIRCLYTGSQNLQIFAIAESSFKYTENVLKTTLCGSVTIVSEAVVYCRCFGKVILVKRSNYGALKICDVKVFGGQYKSLTYHTAHLSYRTPIIPHTYHTAHLSYLPHHRAHHYTFTPYFKSTRT